ncbi:type III secretion system inner membrane ring subunit SctD [Chlamydiales bacterium]|nr:type III secretion system inner membrane ring subunit SctD [Chlamydiales bacterium]
MTGILIAEEGPLKGLVLSFEEGGEWAIGRDPDECQLIIDDPLISRKHFLAKLIDNELSIENLNKENPVYYNDELLENPVFLKEGDRIRAGGNSYTYYLEEPQVSLMKDDAVELDEERQDSILEEGDSGSLEGVTEVHFDLLERERWTLKVVGGPNNGAEFPLQPGSSYVIGTDPTISDIVFHDISVSRQHVRVTLSEQGSITLEDLGSRNGVFVEEDKIENTIHLESNKLVTLGTSTFVILDQEGERSTIISPLLPSIVKVLQKNEQRQEEEEEEEEVEEVKNKPVSLLGAFMLVALISVLFAVVGIGISTLFKTEEVKKQKFDYEQELQEVLTPFSDVRFSYNDVSGRLLLVGHVLTAVDRSQLLYDLQTLPFVKSIDDNIIIDEFVWREINQVVAKNPAWRSVAVIAPSPGKFIVSGYLDTRQQGESLSEYINQNFPYPDLLENRVVVEEDLVSRANILLRNNGFNTVRASFIDGDLKLIGTAPYGERARLAKAIDEISDLQGVRSVQNFVIEQEAAEAVENISARYQVTGFTQQGGRNISVVIKGKILSVNDTLDGMIISSITPSAIYLERGNVKYKIDYNK